MLKWMPFWNMEWMMVKMTVCAVRCMWDMCLENISANISVWIGFVSMLTFLCSSLLEMVNICGLKIYILLYLYVTEVWKQGSSREKQCYRRPELGTWRGFYTCCQLTSTPQHTNTEHSRHTKISTTPYCVHTNQSRCARSSQNQVTIAYKYLTKCDSVNVFTLKAVLEIFFLIFWN